MRERVGERKEKERMSNELRWVRHLHSLPVFFRRGGREGGGRGEKEEMVGEVGVGLKKTSAR